jgi:hypothetical protein
MLRELNEQAVLETIFREGPITRPELATRTGLSTSAARTCAPVPPTSSAS